ncbi:uncharacterized protein LOC120496216 [Passer montanus]|uniref:uncharacterized protein LOC120496216 n=1 Tax=Passer montanus TaxID=9160 RepID=UPI00196211F9|nr:uncharacterized protein LOC120496216 [Passer montanus]XP_039552389.1 uncharacterized protein LOC120496216 [Passer montanus]XP_039552390.1 uncharacterized protein LOC120496216 [Passer montanus]XP_039552391.1 uncharacterized protein LOC120496216 [Passer montanus]
MHISYAQLPSWQRPGNPASCRVLSLSFSTCLFVGFFGLSFLLDFSFFFFPFSSFPNCSLSPKPSPSADNGGLSIAKWLHSCSRGRAAARAFMASNFPCEAARECGDGWLAGAGSRRTLCHGLPPLPKAVIISFIHMQAVVLDGKRLGCGRPSRKPPASLSPPPRAPRVCAICSQLAAACQRLGRAGGSCLCHPWLWLQLWAVDVPVEGTRGGFTSLVFIPELSRARGVVPTELPGLSWRTGHPVGLGAWVSLWDAPHPSRCPRTAGEAVAGSSAEARDGHVPAVPGIAENGQVWTGCDHLAGHSCLWLSQRNNRALDCSFPIPFRPQPRPVHSLSSVSCTSRAALLQFFTGFLVQSSSPPVFHWFSCPCSIPSSCVGTWMVNFTSSIPIPPPTRSFPSALVSSIRQCGECVVEGSLD